ncbi:MAG: hypothetical protein B6229_04785 [Spirochaetaceae bacterium 4572_7]|nr:MAG: hypothetical protein B6229_04785 [Spirochaetaceae bacterium 4572_7]
MTINKIGPLDSINKTTKKAPVQQVKPKDSSDSIKVSKSAASRSELINAANIAKKAPDIRMDKVAEIKAKLQDPNYINSTVINSVADKIMEDFGL